METLGPIKSASPDTEHEINFLLEHDRRDDWRRWRAAAIVSVAVHVVLLIVLVLMPEGETRVYKEPPLRPVQITHLYTPTDLTQKAPNKDKISKQITIAAIPRQPAIKSPVPPPPPKQATAPPPPPQIARGEAKPVFVEPPKPDSPKTQADSQSDQIAKLNAPPPIQPTVEQPKLVFENAVPPPPPSGVRQGGAIALPTPSVAAAIHDLATSGAPTGHQSVGDVGSDLGSLGVGLNLPPSAGRPHSNLELVSDPQGVDFKPYLIQVLASVRRNWFAVYPTAAKTGMRGEVVLEFGIAKQGAVTKVIYTGQTGSKPLDEAAVAAISASNPLPPLPKEFKGDRIVLRLTFMYNMQR